MSTQQSLQECCPKFDPTIWDNKVFDWQDKKFIKDKVFTIFFMPLNYGSVMKRMQEKVVKAGAKIEGYLCLSEHSSKWKMDVLLAVDKEVLNAENVTLGGKFLSKVYEGNFKDTGIWMKDFKKYVKDKGSELKKIYMWYTTCPKCAKKNGKNYTVIIAGIK